MFLPGTLLPRGKLYSLLEYIYFVDVMVVVVVVVGGGSVNRSTRLGVVYNFNHEKKIPGNDLTPPYTWIYSQNYPITIPRTSR